MIGTETQDTHNLAMSSMILRQSILFSTSYMVLVAEEMVLFNKPVNTTKSWFHYVRATTHKCLQEMFVSDTKLKEGNVLVPNKKYLAAKMNSIKESSATFAHEQELSLLVEFKNLRRQWYDLFRQILVVFSCSL